MITVVNKSTLVTDDQVQAMVAACNVQVREHAAPLWNATPMPVVWSKDETTAPAGTWVLGILDDSDQAGALGWHTEDSGGVIYGRVFARDTLAHGHMLDGNFALSAVLSHEVLETFCDAHCNTWADQGTGSLYALEVADPVEGQSYNVVLPDATVVAVSNFVTPAWFDPQAAAGSRFDWMNTVKAPFELTAGGYVVVMAEGQVTRKFGATFPDWKMPDKLSELSRGSRRCRA